MKMSLEPELKVQMELEAHEKECAVRYEMVHGKLASLDKRMWRLEAMIMASTIIVVSLAATLITKI